MKRSERHHLKENVVAVAVGNLREQLSGQGPRAGHRDSRRARPSSSCSAALHGGPGGPQGRPEPLLADALVLADAPVVPPPPPPAAELAE